MGQWSVSYLGPVAIIKHQDQKQVGREKTYFAYTSTF